MAKKSDILVARVSAVLKFDGKRVVLHRGKTTAHANHPLVRGNEQLFTSLMVDYALDEESETNKRLRLESEKQKQGSEEPKEEPKRKGRPPKKSADEKSEDSAVKKEDE